jgi:hypothetical protein
MLRVGRIGSVGVGTRRVLAPFTVNGEGEAMFDAVAGRFLQRDPAGSIGVSWYAYVDDRPPDAIDPLGLEAAPPATGGPAPEEEVNQYRGNGPVTEWDLVAFTGNNSNEDIYGNQTSTSTFIKRWAPQYLARHADVQAGKTEGGEWGGLRSRRELCAALRGVVAQGRTYDRIFLVGHAAYSPVPGSANLGEGDYFTANTISAQCAKYIRDALEPQGTLVLCQCGSAEKNREQWLASLQLFANKIGRRVCACTTKVRIVGTGCECPQPGSQGQWECKTPQ